jgi:uncharacterized protein
MKIHALRLHPGQELKNTIQEFIRDRAIKAGWIAAAVGSLRHYNIRFANQSEGSQADGFFEIVSLVGTLSVNGVHIHISVSDESGTTIGGHLLDGNIVYTTAEIVIAETLEFEFTREKDPSTGYFELVIKKC